MKSIVLALIIFVSVRAYSQDIRVAFMPNLKPFSYLDDDGEKTGFYVDLLTAIAEENDLRIEYVVGTWAENFRAGREGKLDLLIAVTDTEERREFLEYCDEIVISNWTQVIRRKNTSVESVLDLKDQRVGIMAKDQNGAAFLSFIEQFQIDIAVLEYEGHGPMCEALAAGDIAAGVIPNFFDISPYPTLDRTPIIFNAFSTSFAAAKGLNPELLDLLDRQLSEWKADPDSPYYAIFDEYFGTPTVFAIPRWVSILLAVLAVASLTSWFIVRRLTVRLRTTNQRLADWNRNLEAIVEERTHALDESRAQLFQSEKMASLGRMVAGVAHEVNTPIGVALTASSFLIDSLRDAFRDKEDDELTQKELIQLMGVATTSGDIINANLLRAGKIITSFKEVSIDQNLDETRFINLRDYGEAVLQSLIPVIKHTPHRYNLDAEDVVVETYPGSLAQILTNLFENSLVHGFEDVEAGHVDIRLSLDRTADEIVLVFADDGVGIPENLRSTMFEPFVSSKRYKGSSGLGLNIVYNIITKLHGSIDCTSALGEGASFTIKIPVTKYAKGSLHGAADTPTIDDR